MKTQVILGSLFGDEGKGACVQYLVKKALSEGRKPLVVRFSGGAQSAHTIKKGYMTHICSSFGAGVLEGVPTLYIGGYFDVVSYVAECEALEEMGISIPDIYLTNAVAMVTPYDVFANRESAREKTDGTCGKGIFQTFQRQHTIFETPAVKFLSNPDNYLHFVSTYHGGVNHLWDGMVKEAIQSPYVKEHLHDGERTHQFDSYDTWIIEGTQGMLLDKDFGLYPNVTPSNTGLFGLNRALYEYNDSTLQNAEVYFCCRSYLTRHGNGYEPDRFFDSYNLRHNSYETNVENEWQGIFKTGPFNIRLLNESFLRHNVDNMINQYNLKPTLVMSCIDCIWRNWEYIDAIGHHQQIKTTVDIMQDIRDILEHQIPMINPSWNFMFFDNPYSNPFEE